jgi:hypothetical protein
VNRAAVLVTALLVTLSSAPALGAPAAPLEPLSFLLGEWEASGPNQSTGRTTFAPSLQGWAIVRTNSADYPAAGDRPASRHDDLMVIFSAGKALRADYYDSEGHTIHYAVAVPESGKATFLSDLAANEPRYRLSYWLESSGTLNGTFEIAPPGQPGAFKPYLSWQSHKAQAAAATGN